MFYKAYAFKKDVKGWNVCKVSAANDDEGFRAMFEDSGQPSTTLKPPANGECIACPAGATSGSGKYVQGQNPCCLNDSGFRTAVDLWFSNQPLAISTYGNIADW